MSTRSAIARVNGDGFKGVYHHWDGYPSGLGKILWDNAKKVGIKQFLAHAIDSHPAGWSIFPEVCYCHNGPNKISPPDQPITDKEDEGMEWAYVFDESAGTMAVLERVRSNGGHAVGLFGTLGRTEAGEREDAWRIRGVYPLDGPEPEPWENFE